MDKKEFDTRISLISSLQKEAESIMTEFNSEVKYISEYGASFSTNVNNKIKMFTDYLSYINEFSFSDNLTTPSDLFPGIRTVSEMANPDEVKQKADKMKEISINIENTNKLVDTQARTLNTSFKRCYELFTSYYNISSQIYDLQLKLLEDMDSIYDIGAIARNT